MLEDLEDEDDVRAMPRHEVAVDVVDVEGVERVGHVGEPVDRDALAGGVDVARREVDAAVVAQPAVAHRTQLGYPMPMPTSSTQSCGAMKSMTRRMRAWTGPLRYVS